MEFGKHIGKGMWGLAGRALPAVYGLGIMLSVIRILSPEEFGVYTLIQTISLLTVSVAQSFALQPLLKFAAETDNLAQPVTASAALYVGVVLPVAIACTVFGDHIGGILGSPGVGRLAIYLLLVLLLSIPRNIAAFVLQAKLDLRSLFFLDAVYFLGSLAVIAFLALSGMLATAEQVLAVNAVMFAASSLVGFIVLLRVYRLRIHFVGSEIGRIWRYGKYSLGASISYSLYIQSDNLIVSALMGPIPLAVYNAAKVFTKLFEIVLQLISAVTVPVVARWNALGDTKSQLAFAEKTMFFFTAALTAASVMLILGGERLLGLLYGEKYVAAVPVLKILAVSGIFIPAIAVGSGFCYGHGRVTETFRINLIGAIAGIPLLFVGTAFGGLQGVSWVVVVMYGAMAVAWMASIRVVGHVPITLAGVAGRYQDGVNYLKSRYHGAGSVKP